eukprot:1195696-Prorocentrum_minimum.AAC.1
MFSGATRSDKGLSIKINRYNINLLSTRGGLGVAPQDLQHRAVVAQALSASGAGGDHHVAAELHASDGRLLVGIQPRDAHPAQRVGDGAAHDVIQRGRRELRRAAFHALHVYLLARAAGPKPPLPRPVLHQLRDGQRLLPAARLT